MEFHPIKDDDALSPQDRKERLVRLVMDAGDQFAKAILRYATHNKLLRDVNEPRVVESPEP